MKIMELQLSHFLLMLLLHFVTANDSQLKKYLISSEDFNHLKFVSPVHSEPVRFSSRIRRQLANGALTYVYDTDTDESSGNWGPWDTQAQPCSRTCGGGVSVEARQCLDGEGSCTGPIKRYSSCNAQTCPRTSMDFRLEQCAKFNSVPFERRLHEWIPYLKAPRKCELNCMPKGERFYYRHAKKVRI
jgi:hypothetical protein